MKLSKQQKGHYNHRKDYSFYKERYPCLLAMCARLLLPVLNIASQKSHFKVGVKFRCFIFM